MPSRNSRYKKILFEEHMPIERRIMNEGWAPTGKSVRHIGFDQLPILGTPAKEEGNLIGWIVEA
jgi:hypothetical protein